jgi:hypothetical protein
MNEAVCPFEFSVEEYEMLSVISGAVELSFVSSYDKRLP